MSCDLSLVLNHKHAILSPAVRKFAAIANVATGENYLTYYRAALTRMARTQDNLIGFGAVSIPRLKSRLSAGVLCTVVSAAAHRVVPSSVCVRPRGVDFDQ